MMRALANVWTLGLKELASLRHDRIMIVLIIYMFTGAIYSIAHGISTEVVNASIGIVDSDHSQLSGRIAGALQAPLFQSPVMLDRDQVDAAMESGRITFVIDIPPSFEADVLRGNKPAVQILIDATAMTQAGVGSLDIQQIVLNEVTVWLQGRGIEALLPIEVTTRAFFNSNLDSIRFTSVMAIINFITILSIVLVAAAVIREREHGTIEHLLVMPVTPAEIVAAKIWANGAVILAGAFLSLIIMIEGVLGVPIHGSIPLFLAGSAIYLFATTSLGVLLATVAPTMPQFGLLAIPVFIVMNLLSGANTPLESMPEALQTAVQVSPTTHYVAFAQAILYRGAGLDVVWPQVVVMMVIGAVFLAAALARFRNMLATQAG
ncbi:MAG: ABC transporter permease [Methylacidiphilales bacterium]|nr:ABC transporter permease [Candidatus Methylacidiphilales bacterium]